MKSLYFFLHDKLRIQTLNQFIYTFIDCVQHLNNIPKYIFFFFTVPPEKPIIMSENDKAIENTGPYFEGDQVKLRCMVSGGNIIILIVISYIIFPRKF